MLASLRGAQQAWHVPNDGLVTSGRCQGQLNRFGHILGPHVRAEFPANDVAAVIIQNRAEVEPTPTDDLEVGEVGLPHLVDGGGLVSELVGSFDHHIVWCRDQIGFLQKSVSR